MSIFVDTGVFYAQQHEAAGRPEVATDALREMLTGRFGTIYTSDYVHDEAVTLVYIVPNRPVSISRSASVATSGRPAASCCWA